MIAYGLILFDAIATPPSGKASSARSRENDAGRADLNYDSACRRSIPPRISKLCGCWLGRVAYWPG